MALKRIKSACFTLSINSLNKKEKTKLLPSLTTIDQPIKQLGKITTDLMIRLINGEEIDQKEYYLKTTVIKRSSTLGKIATSKE